jgi:hypothetical protein
VAWRGLKSVVVGSPFGSPVSLAPLTFNKHARQPETATPPAMATPGAIDDREPDAQPRELRGQPPGDISTQHRSVQARVQARLPATGAPTDRYEFMAGSRTWPGSPSRQPVMPMTGCSGTIAASQVSVALTRSIGTGAVAMPARLRA